MPLRLRRKPTPLDEAPAAPLITPDFALAPVAELVDEATRKPLPRRLSAPLLAAAAAAGVAAVVGSHRVAEAVYSDGTAADGGDLVNTHLTVQGNLTNTGSARIGGTSTSDMKLAVVGDSTGIELAAGLAGKEGNAGKIKYASGTPATSGEQGWLNVLGAGTTPGQRSMRIWERLYVGSGAFALPTADGDAAIVNSLYVGGRIGIGTGAPVAKLDVQGDVRTTGAITVNGQTAIDTTATAKQTYYAP